MNRNIHAGLNPMDRALAIQRRRRQIIVASTRERGAPRGETTNAYVEAARVGQAPPPQRERPQVEFVDTPAAQIARNKAARRKLLASQGSGDFVE